MQTVTTKFQDAITQPTINVVRVLSYKRRYWNGSAYVWETNWTTLVEPQVIGVSPITAQLDTQTENEFQVSTATITLMNFQNQWALDNPSSIFGADGGSALGYLPYWTKFRVQAGLAFSDGTQELVTLFTGVATDYNFNTTDAQVQVTVTGEQSFLVNANAESVSSSVTLETIGTGDGSTKAFSTSHVGVGIIKTVTVNSVAKSAGTDYQISNLNVAASSATITLTVAPGVGQLVKCSYVYWFQDQKLEDLISDLATAAGIPGGNQDISPVTFPNQITSTHTYSGQTDWESGTLFNNITQDGTGNLGVALPYAPSTFDGGTLGGQAVNNHTSLTMTPSSTTQLTSCIFGTTQLLNGPSGTPVAIFTPYTMPVASALTSINVGNWNASVGTDNWRIAAYLDDGSGNPNLSSGFLFHSATMQRPFSGMGGVTVSVPNVAINGGAVFWVGIILDSGSGHISSVQAVVSTGTSATDSTSSPSWHTLINQSSNPVEIYTQIFYTPNSTTGTYTGPTFDSGSISNNTSLILTSSATLPSGTTYTAFIDGSTDGSTWSTTYSTTDLNGTHTFTVGLFRYWRVRYSFAATNTLSMPTVFLPNFNWGNTGTWIGPTLDMTVAPDSFGPLVISEVLNGGTDTYYTATSADGVTWDAYVQVNGSFIPQSTLRRYVKLKVVQVQNGPQTATPEITSIALVWFSSSIVITLANFTGMTCYDAVTAIAGLCNYEFGFDLNEVFFFRPKNPSQTSLLTIDQSTFVVDVLSHTTGVDRVYSSVVATYGNYTVEVDDPGGTPSSPTNTYGFNQLQPGGTALLISADANLAANIAQTLFNFWSVTRKRTKITTTFLPQIELSDIITLTFHNNQPGDDWFWGDSGVYWGLTSIYYYYAGQGQLIHEQLCKVVGYRIDTDDWSCEYDLEEVV